MAPNEDNNSAQHASKEAAGKANEHKSVLPSSDMNANEENKTDEEKKSNVAAPKIVEENKSVGEAADLAALNQLDLDESSRSMAKVSALQPRTLDSLRFVQDFISSSVNVSG